MDVTKNNATNVENVSKVYTFNLFKNVSQNKLYCVFGCVLKTLLQHDVVLHVDGEDPVHVLLRA